MTVADAGLLVAAEVGTDQREYLARCAAWRSAGPLVRIPHPEFGTFDAVLGYPLADLIARDDRRFRHGPRSLLQPPEPAAAAQPIRSLIDADGPEHRALRALVAEPFGPAAVRRLASPIGALARRLVEQRLRAGRPIDLVDDLAMPYSLQSLMIALGLPGGEADRIHRLSTEPFGRQTGAKLAYLSGLLDLLASSGDRPPLADLLAAERAIGRSQQLMLLLGLLTAGYETTAAAIAGGLRSLMDRPELLAELAGLDGLVEEILRTSSPITGLVRTVGCDTELAGLPLTAGQRLWLCFPAANHDPGSFAEPDRFCSDRFAPDRPAARQLAFGAGRHHCLGAGLARLEIAELLRALAEAGVSVQPAGASRFHQHHFLSRYLRLPGRLQAG